MQSNKIDIQDLTVEELQNLQQEAKQLIETKRGKYHSSIRTNFKAT